MIVFQYCWRMCVCVCVCVWERETVRERERERERQRERETEREIMRSFASSPIYLSLFILLTDYLVNFANYIFWTLAHSSHFDRGDLGVAIAWIAREAVRVFPYTQLGLWLGKRRLLASAGWRHTSQPWHALWWRHAVSSGQVPKRAILGWRYAY